MSTNSNTFIDGYSALYLESKADRITELLLSGKLSKAEIAKAVGANYSQVHGKAKQLIAAGQIGQPPMGKKGRSSISPASSSPIKRTPVARRPAKGAIVAKPVATARPAGVSAPPTALENSVDQMIIHMLSVIDSPTYADLVTAASDAVTPEDHDMNTNEVSDLVRSRIKSLVSRGEIFQSKSGVFTAAPTQDEDEDTEIGDDELDAFKVDNDDDDGDGEFMKSYFDSGRRTGGYHL